MTKNQQSYQELKSALDTIMAKLQTDNVDVDEAIALHKEGQAILKKLDAYLQTVAEQAEIEITRVD